MPELLIRTAKPSEAGQLSALALRAKAYWGYSAEFIESCRLELNWSKAEFEEQHSMNSTAEIGDKLVGFYRLIPMDSTAGVLQMEIEALFVEPQWIGNGIGRELLRHAETAARERGVTLLVIQSDPYAESFYQARGAIRVGETPSESIADRFLPLLHLSL